MFKKTVRAVILDGVLNLIKHFVVKTAATTSLLSPHEVTNSSLGRIILVIFLIL